MRAIEPTVVHSDARRVTFTGQKPHVSDLPATMNDSGLVLTEWMLSAEDLARLLRGGTVRLWVHLGKARFPPVKMETVEPEP
jgi:hypothetical protein